MRRQVFRGFVGVALLASSVSVLAGDPISDMQREIETGKAQPPPPLKPAYIAFSLSQRCLQDSCGDGKFGVGLGVTTGQAQRRAADTCAAATLRQGSCGNAGTWPACRRDSKPSWAALAIYDDFRETMNDGEAVAYPDKASASAAAIKNCEVGVHVCRIVWVDQIVCPPNANYGDGAAIVTVVN